MESQLEAQLEAGQEALQQTTGLLAGLWQKLVNYLPTLTIALIVFLIGMLIAGCINKLIYHAMNKAKLNATAAGFGKSLIRILLYTVLIIICLSILGVPMASIVAVVGAAGLAVGLALQNSLSNLAGGFIILFAKPFQHGDYIVIGNDAGFVESVTILYTELVTLDNRTIFLPNSIVSSSAVQNLSKNGTLRVNVPVQVSYQTDLSIAKEVMLKAVQSLPISRKDPAPSIAVTALGDNGITLTAFFWVSKSDYFIAPGKLLEAVKPAFDAAGIEIPYPQLDIHDNTGKGESVHENHR